MIQLYVPLHEHTLYNNVITQEDLHRLSQVHLLLVIVVDLSYRAFLYLSFFLSHNTLD